MIEKRAFIHMPRAREAGVWVVVYYGSSRRFARTSSRRFVWLGQSVTEDMPSFPRFRWRELGWSATIALTAFKRTWFCQRRMASSRYQVDQG